MAVRHLQHHLPRYSIRPLLAPVGVMIFFFVIFDGALMYLAPIVITQAGISESLMGIIIGSSSIAGLLFDIVLCRLFKDTNYRSMFLWMFVTAALYPIFLFGGTTITLYLLAMAIWGFYYNFYNIGTLDYVGRTIDPIHHTSSFGNLRAFEGLGYLIAPFIGSLLLLYFNPGPQMLIMIALPLFISFLIYIVFVHNEMQEGEKRVHVARRGSLGLIRELRLWEVIGGPILWLLFLTLTINLVDSAIWTFGPIFSESTGALTGFPSWVFMMAYALPPLLVGWFVGVVARRYGTQHTAQGAIAVGSLLFMIIGFVTAPWLLVALILIASFCLSIGWPAINALYTEHIHDTPARSKEIETLQDLFTNLGDTSGPIVAGYLCQYVGPAYSFTALGSIGLAIACILFVLKRRRVQHRTDAR